MIVFSAQLLQEYIAIIYADINILTHPSQNVYVCLKTKTTA